MSATASPVVVRAELPTPDVVVVQPGSGPLILFVDVTVPKAEVDRVIAELETILAGTPHALG